MNFKPLFFVFLTLTFPAAFAQQYMHSDMFYTAPFSFNPAFTGYTGGSRLVGQYRRSFEEEERMADVTYDHYINKLGLGLGLNAQRKSEVLSEGDYYEYHKTGILASKKIIAREHFAVMTGMQLSYFDRREELADFFSRRSFIYTEPYVPEPKRYNGFDVSTGIWARYKGLMAGMGIDFKDDHYKLNTYTYHLLYQKLWKEKYGASFDINMIRYGSGSVGCAFKFYRLRLGYRLVGYSFSDGAAHVFYMGYRQEHWAIKLSHGGYDNRDYPEDLFVYPSEISLSFYFGRKEGKQQFDQPEIIAF